jgi:signal transduction histidine kinase
LPDWADFVNVVVGVLQLVLAGVVLRHLGRFGRAYPWLALLMAYFMLRGVDRIYTAFVGVGEEAFSLFSDAVLVIVLVMLIVGIRRTVSGLRFAEDSAHLREVEYQRALSDYRVLARHRLANPLTAVLGGITTLRDMPDLDPETRDELLAQMEAAAQQLERVSLDPKAESPEERSLEPSPRLEQHRPRPLG